MRTPLARARGCAVAFAAVLAIATGLRGAETDGPAQEEDIVELPPLEVSAGEQAPPWRYVAVRGAEVLTRCDAELTRAFLERERRLLQLLELVLPPEFRATYEMPAVMILSDPRSTPVSARDVVTGFAEKEKLSGKSAAPRTDAAIERARSIRYLPNLRIGDLDASAVFAILDERTYRPEHMTLTDDFVRLAFARRTPALPAWYREGFLGLYADVRYGAETVGVRQADWVTAEETENLRTDREYPRTLLSMRALLEAAPPDAAVAPEAARLWRAQATLLVRWGLEEVRGRRAGFWTFVRRAIVEGASERLLRECLGLGYADLRDQLSDYLPHAVATPLRLRAGKLAPLPKYELRLATPGEIGRLKGEWDRLAMLDVKHRHPRHVARYEEQVLRTLAPALAQAPADPALLGVVGLYECDAGNDSAARLHLEAAVKAGAQRPRVHYELARLRYARFLADNGGGEKRLAPEQVEAVVEPLAEVWGRQPAFVEAYMLAADVWSRSGVAPEPAVREVLDEGGRLFPHDARLLFFTARLEIVHGSRTRAAGLVERALQQRPGAVIEARLRELQAWLAREAASGARIND